jgi:DNA-binding MarR family transcriptional regulator
MPSTPTPDDVAHALVVGIRLLVRRIRQTRDDALTMGESSALVRLELGGPLTVTALAKLERISAQSMGATLAALEERGLVRRAPDPSDGRQSILSITAAGAKTLHDRRSERTQQIARALSNGFSQKELTQLLAAAPLLERLAERM